jgi:hypothetical protein
MSADFLAKSGVRQAVRVSDDDVVAVIQALKRRRGGGPELLAWPAAGTAERLSPGVMPSESRPAFCRADRI